VSCCNLYSAFPILSFLCLGLSRLHQISSCDKVAEHGYQYIVQNTLISQETFKCKKYGIKRKDRELLLGILYFVYLFIMYLGSKIILK
jgi:hypothetical protein